MTYLANQDFLIEVAKGNIAGHSIVHKFGRYDAIGTTYTPVAGGGIYQTPQVSGATTLRIRAGGHANDTAAGIGAREITLEGLDETGATVIETLATAGASASSVTTATFIRLFRVHVSASGSYATSAMPSHADTITIENGAGGTDWTSIVDTDFARSQSEIGVYTVPLGKTAYILGVNVTIDSSKVADVIFFQRRNILETAAPYTAMRMLFQLTGIIAPESIKPKAPFGGFPALTDVGAMAKVSTGTGSIEVDFDILLVDD